MNLPSSSKTIPIYQADAFVAPNMRGNPAAICILQDWLDDEIMPRPRYRFGPLRSRLLLVGAPRKNPAHGEAIVFARRPHRMRSKRRSHPPDGPGIALFDGDNLRLNKSESDLYFTGKYMLRVRFVVSDVSRVKSLPAEIARGCNIRPYEG